MKLTVPFLKHCTVKNNAYVSTFCNRSGFRATAEVFNICSCYQVLHAYQMIQFLTLRSLIVLILYHYCLQYTTRLGIVKECVEIYNMFAGVTFKMIPFFNTDKPDKIAMILKPATEMII